MVLHMFVGSLLPSIECLDSWLFEGTLEDPYEEVNLGYNHFLIFIALKELYLTSIACSRVPS